MDFYSSRKTSSYRNNLFSLNHPRNYKFVKFFFAKILRKNYPVLLYLIRKILYCGLLFPFRVEREALPFFQRNTAAEPDMFSASVSFRVPARQNMVFSIHYIGAELRIRSSAVI